MTKSTITRERAQQIFLGNGPEPSASEERELARMALAAMDSEPVELPLDYLHGHKDGLEWAAQLAEANHPETGDWLYDDPIELAKAIRKGTDMPPVQPVADREPDRNPVLAYADSYRDMAKQGVESVPIWSVITDLERNIAPLYRHAQPVPVVPYDFDFDRFNDVVWLECVASNPHMHSPTTSIIARVALELNKRILAGNSPVIPEGYVMVPKEPTEQMYDAGDRQMATKQVWDAMLAAAPQQHNAPQNIPEIIPGWIPVSERMPEPGILVLVYTPPQPGDYPGDVRIGFDYIDPDGDDPTYWFNHGESYEHFCCVACDGMTGPSEKAPYTHWMPLPAAPQEVKGD
nr:MAG TPA: Protein of unknown function (DUF551) [Caudoviricetes sp.]